MPAGLPEVLFNIVVLSCMCPTLMRELVIIHPPAGSCETYIREWAGYAPIGYAFCSTSYRTPMRRRSPRIWMYRPTCGWQRRTIKKIRMMKSKASFTYMPSRVINGPKNINLIVCE